MEQKKSCNTLLMIARLRADKTAAAMANQMSTVILCFILSLIYGQHINAQALKSNKSMWCIIGIKADYILIKGAFNGEDYFTTDDEIIIVPDINSAPGFGITAGANFRVFSYDFTYYRSVHHYSYIDENFSATCTSNIIRFLGIKGYFNPDKWFNPFIDFDISGHWITLKKGAIREDAPEKIIPATYGGISLGLGGGVSFQACRQFSLDIGAMASWLVGTDVKARKSKYYEISRFSNMLLNCSLGLTYHFR